MNNIIQLKDLCSFLGVNHFNINIDSKFGVKPLIGASFLNKSYVVFNNKLTDFSLFFEHINNTVLFDYNQKNYPRIHTDFALKFIKDNVNTTIDSINRIKFFIPIEIFNNVNIQTYLENSIYCYALITTFVEFSIKRYIINYPIYLT